MKPLPFQVGYKNKCMYSKYGSVRTILTVMKVITIGCMDVCAYEIRDVSHSAHARGRNTMKQVTQKEWKVEAEW